MAPSRRTSDRRALVVAGVGGFLLLGLPSAVELAPWRRGRLELAPDGELILAAAGSRFVVWLAVVILAATVIPGVIAVVVLLRTRVLSLPRGRRLAVLAALGLFVGVARTAIVRSAIPGIVPDVMAVAELVLASAEALVALALVSYYLDTRQRIQEEEAERIEQAHRAERAQAQLEHEELRIRREVAQKLHGGLQQRLVVAIHQLEVISEDLRSRGQAEAAAAVDDVTESLDRVREAEVRAVAHALYPLAADVELPAALMLLADQLPPSVRMDVRYDGELPDELTGHAMMPPDRVVLFTAVEEGVTNAIRHGRARQIQVMLAADRRPDGDGVTATVLVDDDGAGLRGERPVLAGLAALQERVRRRGGQLTLGPSPLGGARLLVALPVQLAASGAGARR